MEQLKTLISNVQLAFTRLTPRERRLVTAAGVAVALFIVFAVLFSFSSAASRHQRNITERLKSLAQIQELAVSYHQAEQARQAVERELSASNIRLISYLEEKGTEAGLEIRIMNPKAEVALSEGKILESGVDITLSDITLDKLMKFLSTVEAGPGVVKVKYLRVEPQPENQTLSAWVAVATYRMKN